jgi:hypothetical protein
VHLDLKLLELVVQFIKLLQQLEILLGLLLQLLLEGPLNLLQLVLLMLDHLVEFLLVVVLHRVVLHGLVLPLLLDQVDLVVIEPTVALQHPLILVTHLINLLLALH